MYSAGIEAFLAIVQTQNLNKAAELLHLTQATVSYRLKTLEADMGAVLVERGKGIQRVTLTPFGESFVAIAERWDALKRDTEKLQASGPQLSLAVGGSNSLNTYVLPPLYRALMRHSPAIRLTFRTQHSVELWNALERREVDVAFVKMERSVPNISVEPFFLDESVLIRRAVPENDALRTIHPTELSTENEIYWNWGPSFQLWHDRWWDPLRSSHAVVDVAGLIFSLMEDDKQWSVVPKSVADSFVRSGQFTIQPLLDLPPARICYKLTHKYPKPSTVRGLECLEQYINLIFPQKSCPVCQNC
ncbi:DNA-binding transcriptional LysR family regulator [Anaerospora hongkongensis]|uniref:DNA-binding transcriptional LysR family regulator n=1 Tax=Anaerospora hongkongensis TaxID=244830 RepID=A0A4R1Q6Q8_9FIRM|nr:LysR family transcriptional regulator [Anaerospora hongkongensis]TCL37657.1 DNA-binding transcriptional LysR family regulator [Anaerospora hongkongensis]